MKKQRSYRWILIILLLIVLGLALLYYFAAQRQETVSPAEAPAAGVDSLYAAWAPGPGRELAVKHCTACHSAALVTQNRLSAEGWQATLRWMQESQGLWDLGKDETPLLHYLEKNYAPRFEGRRKPLAKIAWYELELN